MDAKIQKAAKEGNIYAMLAIAYMYQKGKDTDLSPADAVIWYERSAAAGCSRAKWELAKMYRFSEVPDPGRQKYIYWLQAAADAGIPEARRELSARYFYGSLLPKDEEKSMYWIRLAAEGNDPLSEFRYAYALEIGYAGQHDPDTAAKMYEKFNTSGDAELFFKIGQNFEFGLEGCRADIKRACNYYRMGARMGHDKSYFSLTRAVATIEGRQRQDSFMERRNLILQTPSALEEEKRDGTLAEADDLMEEGLFEEAIDRYQESADLGNTDAMFMLAMLYHDGSIVRRNDHLAFEYLTKASLSGSCDAQLFLGRSYESGRGKNKNIEEAIKYFAMSAAGGNMVGYYYLSKYMPRPELYVRSIQRIVR